MSKVIDLVKNPDKDTSADFFYHAVSNDILETYYKDQGFIWNEYYKGAWITSDIWHAMSFGRNLFRIDGLKLCEEMDWDNPNDGILYKGKISMVDTCLVNDNIYDRDYKKLVHYRQYMKSLLDS